MVPENAFDHEEWLRRMQKEFEDVIKDSLEDFKGQVIDEKYFDEEKVKLGVSKIGNKLVRSVRINMDRLEEFFRVD